MAFTTAEYIEMEAELQTNEELGTGETGEELATSETQDESEKAPEGFIRAEDAQKDINKQHRKYRDEERARKKLEAEAEKLKRELEEFKAKSVDLSIPPPPDRYADDFEAQQSKREEAIQRKALHDANKERLEAQKTEADARKAEAEAAELQQKVAGFDANMVSLGLNPVEIKQAADQLIDYGISETFQDILLEHPEGPAIVKLLADNPVELDTLSGMTTLQLVEHLNGDISKRASLLRPQTSKAPDPPITLTGGGVKELDDPLLRGATFE